MPAPSSRRVPPVMWFIPDTPSRYMGLAATGLPSRFMMAMAASLGIRANRCRSVPAMCPLRQPPDLHRLHMPSRLTSEAAVGRISPTGPRYARPDGRLRRNPPFLIPEMAGYGFA
jgi:hypothetical protein